MLGIFVYQKNISTNCQVCNNTDKPIVLLNNQTSDPPAGGLISDIRQAAVFGLK